MAFVYSSFFPTGEEKLCKRFTPVHPGDVVCVRGVFPDGSKHGDTVIMILHEDERRNQYGVRVLEVRNKDYRHHLQEREGRSQIPIFRLAANEEDLRCDEGYKEVEKVASWRIIAQCGDDIDFSLLPWMTLPAHRNKFAESVTFMLEYMKSDVAAREKVGGVFTPAATPRL